MKEKAIGKAQESCFQGFLARTTKRKEENVSYSLKSFAPFPLEL